MPKRRKTLVIKDPEIIRALRTPARQEVLTALEVLGEGSVKDIARELGKAPASLYYHVHALSEAGLICRAGTRTTGRRDEMVYKPAATRIVIDRRGTSREFIEALSDLHSSALRATEREVRASLKEKSANGTPPGDSVTLLRLTAHLKPADARKARRRLQEVAAFIAEHDDPDGTTSYAFTATLAELVSFPAA